MRTQRSVVPAPTSTTIVWTRASRPVGDGERLRDDHRAVDLAVEDASQIATVDPERLGRHADDRVDRGLRVPVLGQCQLQQPSDDLAHCLLVPGRAFLDQAPLEWPTQIEHRSLLQGLDAHEHVAPEDLARDHVPRPADVASHHVALAVRGGDRAARRPQVDAHLEHGLPGRGRRSAWPSSGACRIRPWAAGTRRSCGCPRPGLRRSLEGSSRPATARSRRRRRGRTPRPGPPASPHRSGRRRVRTSRRDPADRGSPPAGVRRATAESRSPAPGCRPAGPGRTPRRGGGAGRRGSSPGLPSSHARASAESSGSSVGPR